MSDRPGPGGAISAGCAEAAQVGAAVLAGGGNAVDAAIAASAVQCVRELPWCGLGGDAFAIVSEPDGRVEALNGAGAVPQALATAAIPGGTLPRYGPLSISVPGLVDAWGRLWERYGTKPFASLLEPAAELAADGFALDAAFVRALERARGALGAGDPFVAEFCDGNGAGVGERYRLDSLARTLREIGAQGPDAFYRGRLGAAVAASVGELGGLLCADDLAAHASCFEAPLSVGYGSAQVSVTPPVSMGWMLLQMLSLYDRLGGSATCDGADRIDLMVRCKHAAFADLAALRGWQSAADVEGVLASESLQRWQALISSERMAASAPLGVPAAASAAAGGTDTTCLAAVDSDGLMVTFIHSLFNEFGSRVAVPGTGIVLNDRLAKQPARLGGPENRQRPPRPLHTLVGYHVQAGDRRLVGATPGGRGQVQTNFQVLRAIIDDGADPQDAVDRPRWLSGTPRLPDAEDLLFLEPGLGSGTAADLDRRGHSVAADGASDEIDLFGSCTIVGMAEGSGDGAGAGDGSGASGAEIFGAADRRRGAVMCRAGSAARIDRSTNAAAP